MARPGTRRYAQDLIRIADRRQEVLALYRTGITQRAIALQLGLTEDVVSMDMKAIKQMWRDKMAQEIGAIAGLELVKLDELERALWDDAMKGRPHVVERVIQVMDHRAKILGLYAPTKGKVAVVTEDQIDDLIGQYKRRLEQLAGGAKPRQALEAGRVEEAGGAGGEESAV